MKKILFVIGVVVLALGGVLIAPSLVDWNARLPEITAQVKSATGRDLTVSGRLEVSLLPAPTLTAHGVTLGNAEGGSVPEMASLEAVEVRVALLPLLSGQVQVQRVALVKPVITIEKFADGRTNLEFQSATAPAQAGAADATAPDAQAGAAGMGPGVRLDNFEIQGGTIHYIDHAAGTREKVEDMDATLRAVSLQGPFDAEGQVRVRGVPLSFQASLGQIIAERTVPLSAKIGAPGGTSAEINGAIFDLAAQPRLKGKVKMEGQNLSQLVAALSGGGSAPAFLKQAFGLGGELNASAASAALQDLELTLGATRATGGAQVDMGDAVDFDVALKIGRLDADELLKNTAGVPAAPAASSSSSSESAAGGAPEQGGGEVAAGGFTLPQGVTGTLSVEIGAVTLKGGVLSDVRLNAELADGELALSQFQMQAPGVTDVALFGFVKPQDGQPRFSGEVDVAVSNPKGLTDWLGVRVPEGVLGRLKRIEYKSQVAADPERVTLSDLTLSGDHTQVTGGVTVALQARPSFGADLAVDALDLDAYLAKNGNANGAAAADAPAAQAAASGETAQAGAADVAGAWTSLGALNDFDANMKVRVGRLASGGRSFSDILFDGTLYDGKLELRQLRLGDHLGAGGTLSGTFGSFGAIPEMAGVKLDARVKDAAALAARLGVAGVPQGVGAVTVQAGAEGTVLKPRFTVDVGALGGNFGAAGSFSLLPIGFGYEGGVTATHPDTVKMLSALGYRAAGPLGALNVKAQLKTDGANHDLTAIQGRIGDTDIQGAVNAKTGGAKPQVVANLQTGALDVQAFLAAADKRADAAPQAPARWGRIDGTSAIRLAAFDDVAQETAQEIAQAASRADKRWSREAFDLSALEQVNGELTLKSAALSFGDYRLDNADIHATVQDGVLNADRVAGLLFGGPVAGTAVVRAAGRPTIESNIKLDAMNVAQAVRTVAGKDLATGQLALTMAINATGKSPADLVSTLTGQGAMNIAALDVKQGGTGTALAPVIGLVAAMNQLALPVGGKPQAGLADMALSFDIQDGVANAKNVTVNSAAGSGTGKGTVDIAAWTIDFAGNMTVEPNLLTSLISKGRIGRQEVPFSLKGALDKPGVKLAVNPAGAGQPGAAPADPMQQLLQQVLPGAKTQPQAQPQQQDGTLAPPPSQQPQQPQQKVRPEDIIKKLMQGM